MSWPNPPDYHEAIQNPHVCFKDPDLKAGQVVCTPLGLPRVMAGNFAAVYEVKGAKNWAVRCFLRQVSDQRERYQRLSKYLSNFALNTLVEFYYLEEGIRVKGSWFPIVKMEWVDGEALNTFVERNLNDQKTLEKMIRTWRGQVVGSLRGCHLAHGDLQHGNVMVKPQGEILLVDYDAMFVPPDHNNPDPGKSPELGHPNFQHPARTADFYNQDLDNFSALVIYTSLKALIAEPKLWKQYNTSDNLLLTAPDYQEPKKSKVLQQLKRNSDPVVKNLADMIEQCCLNPIEQVPDFESMLAAAVHTTELPHPSQQQLHRQQQQHQQQEQGQQQQQKQQQKPAPVKPSVPTPTPTPRPGISIRFPLRKVLPVGVVALLLLSLIVWWFWSGVKPANFSGIVQLQPLGNSAEVTAVAFSPDEKVLASGDKNGTLKLWNSGDWTSLESFKISSMNVTLLSLVFSHDGKILAISTNDSKVVLWDLAAKQKVTKQPTCNVQVNSVAFSPDDKTLIGGCEDGQIKFWNIETGDEKSMPFKPNHKPSVKSVAFSPDGKTVASGGADAGGGGTPDYSIKIWDAETGNAKSTLKSEHSGAVTSLAFSSDSKLLASGGEDSFIYIWDIQKPQSTNKLRDHNGAVRSVKFWPDDKTLVSGGDDGVVRLWDPKALGTAPKKLPHGGKVYSVAVSPYGNFIASGGEDKNIKVWSNK